MSIPSQGGYPTSIDAQEQTIEISLQTRRKLAELMDQIDETVAALRLEVEQAKIRRGEI
jgi:antitoxin component of MazEF toxin-antitoxin module